MSTSVKRKDAPTGNSTKAQSSKKKKFGNEGKWKTTHQQSKERGLQEGVVSPGEIGIWVTCARTQEAKAAREVVAMFDEYAELLYGIKEPGQEEADEDEEEDIEAAVQKELAAMKATGKEAKEGGRIFTPVKMNVACLLFVRTRAPVEPVSFVKRICQDAKIPGKQRCRYVNRLIPMTAIGKATEAGLFDVACKVLGETFALKRAEVDPTVELTPEAKAASEEMVQKLNDALDTVRGGPSAEAPPPVCTFAIRPSIRNNNTLARDVIIKKVAGLIDGARHMVNLEKPDKVILIEVYQNSCGISVVDGDYWDDLKKYNLTELYSLAHKQRDEQKNQPQEGEKAQSTEDKAKSTGEETRQAEETDLKAQPV